MNGLINGLLDGLMDVRRMYGRLYLCIDNMVCKVSSVVQTVYFMLSACRCC